MGFFEDSIRKRHDGGLIGVPPMYVVKFAAPPTGIGIAFRAVGISKVGASIFTTPEAIQQPQVSPS